MTLGFKSWWQPAVLYFANNKLTLTGRCAPRPHFCSLTSATAASHQVVACIAPVGGSFSKCCSSSMTDLAIGWVSQCRNSHLSKRGLHHIDVCSAYVLQKNMHMTALRKSHSRMALIVQSTLSQACTVKFQPNTQILMLLLSLQSSNAFYWDSAHKHRDTINN